MQMKKDISKPAARKILKEKSGEELHKTQDNWYQTRIDIKEAAKNAKVYKKSYENTLPETLASDVTNTMWKKAKALKDEFTVGMLTKAEMHPVKGFLENGTMKYVVDQELLRTNQSVEREAAWLAKNTEKIAEYKNIMRHLDPDNPNAGDIERFRKKEKIS